MSADLAQCAAAVLAFIRHKGPIVPGRYSVVGQAARAAGCSRARTEWALWHLEEQGLVVLGRAGTPRKPIIRAEAAP